MRQIGSDDVGSRPGTPTTPPVQFSPVVPGEVFQGIIIDLREVLVIGRRHGTGDIPECREDLPADAERPRSDAGPEFLFRHRFCMDEPVAGIADHEDVALPVFGTRIPLMNSRGNPVEFKTGPGKILPAELAGTLNGPFDPLFPFLRNPSC